MASDKQQQLISCQNCQNSEYVVPHLDIIQMKSIFEQKKGRSGADCQAILIFHSSRQFYLRTSWTVHPHGWQWLVNCLDFV